ncbi:ribosomal protein L7/L12 [bacterium]|nr:ribosomal protein L7/L12 [bacterium]
MTISNILISFVVILFIIVFTRKKKEKIMIISEPVVGNGNFDLTIVDVKNDHKIEALKELRYITSYDLQRVKFIIDNSPYKLFQNIDSEHAEELKNRLERCGCIISITETER